MTSSNRPPKAKGKPQPKIRLQIAIGHHEILNQYRLADVFHRDVRWVRLHFADFPFTEIGEERLYRWGAVLDWLEKKQCREKPVTEPPTGSPASP